MKNDNQQIPSTGSDDASGVKIGNRITDAPPTPTRAYFPILTALLLVAFFVICIAVATRTVVSRLAEESDRIVARIIQAQATLSESQLTAFRSALDQQRTVIERSRDDVLKCLAKDAGPAGNSASVSSKQAAAGQRALQLGAAALESGNTDQAILLFINGINHDPSRIELIRALADAAFATPNGDIAERAIGVLELATVQVAPDDVPETLNHIDRLRNKFAPSPVKALSPDEAQRQWQEIKERYSPENIWHDISLVSRGLSEIEFLGQQIDASRVDGQDDRFNGVLDESHELSARLQTVHTALPLYLHITNCISQMKEALNTASPDAALISSLSASAQGVLAQTWGQMPHLPAPMRDAFNMLPQQIHNIEAAFQQKTSAPILARAVNNLRRAVGNKSGSLTERIHRISAALDTATADADLITAREFRSALLMEVKKARDALLALEIERRSAYQRWALERLNGFLTDWNSHIIINNKEAQAIFTKHQIAMIDETLIIPEVARLLARVMTCMTGELDPKGGSKVEYDLAASPKMRLEDF